MDYLEEPAFAWVRWLERRKTARDSVIALIQKADERLANDPASRRSELKRLQRSYYRAVIASTLVKTKTHSPSPERELLEAAHNIIEKRGYTSGSHDSRSLEEERMYGAARVRWAKLLKSARVRTADRRGGDTSKFRLPAHDSHALEESG